MIDAQPCRCSRLPTGYLRSSAGRAGTFFEEEMRRMEFTQLIIDWTIIQFCVEVLLGAWLLWTMTWLSWRTSQWLADLVIRHVLGKF